MKPSAAPRLMTCRTAALLAAALTATAPASNDYLSAAVQRLDRARTPRRDGSHFDALAALRELKDPALLPWWKRMLDHDHWEMRVQAVLAMAEIDPGVITPEVISPLPPQAQEAMIAHAIDLDLLSPDQMKQCAAADLDPVARLLLLAELDLAGLPPTRETLAAHSGPAASPRVAALAALLLARQGDLSLFNSHLDLLPSLNPSQLHDHLHWLIEAARQYEVRSLRGWIHDLIADPSLDQRVKYWAAYAAISLDGEAAVDAWRVALGDDPSYLDRVRYAMLLLAAGDSVHRAAWEHVPHDDPLLSAMAAAGVAISGGSDPAPALIRLLDLDHRQTSEWAMGMLQTLPDEQAKEVCLHLLDRLTERGSIETNQMTRLMRAAQASSLLARIDLPLVEERLAAAPDDSPMQEAILLGLIDSGAEGAGALAPNVRRIGAGRADSLALLLLAQQEQPLPEGDLQHLGRIAAGGSGLPARLEARAAWLYLKRTGRTDEALHD